jgi:hypothetical protein
MKKLSYSYKQLIIYFLVAFIAFSVTYFEVIDTSKLQKLFSKADQYQPNYTKQHITEYAFIYVGSSRCTYSNDEQIYEAIKQIKLELSNRTKRENFGFHTIGIASELNAESGIDHLSNFGNFNEKIVGAGWNNVGVNRFLYKYSQDFATPSILVTKRTYNDSTFRQIEKEELLYSVSGKIRIVNWLNNGINLPKHISDE